MYVVSCSVDRAIGREKEDRRKREREGRENMKKVKVDVVETKCTIIRDP